MIAPESILICNSNAISLLREGEAAASVEILKSAIVELKARYEANTCRCDPIQRSSHSLARSVRIFDQEDAARKPSSDSSNQLFDFYPRAFDVAWGATDQQVVVTILYNLALTHDIQALCTDDPSEIHTCQDQALRLYTSAMKFGNRTWSKDDVKTMQCVIVAMVNNMGRLQSIHQSFVDTKHLMKLSMDLLNAPSVCSRIEEEDYYLLCSSISPFMALGDNVLTVAPSA